jgi:E3 ubiquitin-protein ligase TRIP12
VPVEQHDDDDSGDNDDDDHEGDEDDDEDAAAAAAALGYSGAEPGDDPFSGAFLSRAGMPAGLSSTLRALSGMMSGMTTRLRGIMENLRAKDDPSVQMVALTELSEILLVSNEDNLAGHFSPDQFVKELVELMQPNDFTGEENPEMMLLACRCIANLMEALPQATASVVYGGAVPVLCQKLLEIHYIDVAEQALSTLEKISIEFPASIVREGGLNACLTYLDFFATSTQRSAVTTAANCCRNLSEDSFPTVRDVMPILLNVLSSSDQRVVEQGSLCVSRIVESFRYHESKLEELVSPELLKAVLRLLLPGTTTMIGPSIHTQFLRVLSIAARASPRLAVELLRMDVVDTLYQILTGVSPPSSTDDAAVKIDKNIIMQALIRTPRDQIFETLNVVCEVLPSVSPDNLMFINDLTDAGNTGPGSVSMGTRARSSPNDNRLELLRGCQSEVRRFAVILFPTLMHAYTSTVNLSVRQKVLTAQLKMLSNLDTDVLKVALSGVAYASHLASILTQEENPMLVTFALQIAELLLKRLESTYRPQFYREGVMAEINKLAKRELSPPNPTEPDDTSAPPADAPSFSAELPVRPEHDDNDDGEPSEPDYPDEGSAGEHDDDDHDDDDDDDSGSDSGAQNLHTPPTASVRDIITSRARKFVEAYQNDGGLGEASRALSELKRLAEDLRDCYNSNNLSEGPALFQRLAKHFDGDTLESITSYELLTSDIVSTLLEIFKSSDSHTGRAARSAFLDAFMSQKGQVAGDMTSPATAFSSLVHKLQDLLSRTEHFEVITVHQNASDSSRSGAASMLAKQLRIKLSADDDSGIPRPYRNIMVSIHAIATFRALDDYLRPRISLAERAVRSRDALTNSLAEAVARESGNATGGASTLPASKRTHTKSSKLDSTPQNSGDPTSRLRRSSRKVSQKDSDEAEDDQHQLECADEAALSDEDEEDEEDLDAIVNDFDDEDEDMDDADQDTSAVNLEVANSGKVTAHKEDGTRISTPLQGSQQSATSRTSASARLAAARELLSTPSQRPSANAPALQPASQDWHIEFSVDGQPLSNDTTIYRAVHFNQTNPDEVSSRNIWSTLHKICFRRAPGPPPAEPSTLHSSSDASTASTSELPPSLSQHPATAAILRLMSTLHDMNANLEDIIAEEQSNDTQMSPEPLAQFVNTKLTAKLNRQLEEPLIVASNCLPTWSEDLARLYPFLFPFETRHFFLQSTSFGYSRSMTRWQNAQSENESRRHRDERPFLGRLQRQKVRISRSRILESAIKVMELYGSSPSILEVEYFEEVGTGLGPTLEFYSTVSREFSKKKIKLWRENESIPGDDYAFGMRGLFPAPMSEEQSKDEHGKKVLHLFKMLGKFVARSMLDSRIIDVSFNPTFFRIGAGNSAIKPSLGAVASVDKDLANSLKPLVRCVRAKQEIQDDDRLSAEQKTRAIRDIRIKDASIEDLGLDFTLPGYPTIELQQNGAEVDVTIDNVEHYVEKVIDFTLGQGVQKQVDAFCAGFSQVFPYSALNSFTPDELVMLFGRAEEDWSLETLMDSIKADHGFNLDSASVKNLLQTMSEFTMPERRDFLQFVTGSPKLPIGGKLRSSVTIFDNCANHEAGFKSLTPMFTVVCKPNEPPLMPDDYLPSVMTCVNYLKMPNYTSQEMLRAKLSFAIKEGQGAFHLS